MDYKLTTLFKTPLLNNSVTAPFYVFAHTVPGPIINYDKILVLDQGEVKEFDTPSNCSKNQSQVYSINYVPLLRLTVKISKLIEIPFSNN